jgi:hypothetical protein
MAFLTPKHGGPFWAAFGMGAGYLLLHGAVEFLLTRFFTGTVPAMFRTGIVAIFLFILSLLFYRREIGKQLFLLFSFFAIYRISIFLYVLMNAVLPLSSWFVGILLSNETILQSGTEAIQLLVNAFLYITNAVVHAVYLSLTVYSISKSFTYKRQNFQRGEAFSLILPCLPAPVVTYAFTIIDSRTAAGLLSLDKEFHILGLLLLVTLLLTVIFSVRQFQKTRRFYMEAKDAAILREQVKQLHNMDSGGVYNEIRGMRHDMKNHLSNMRLLMKQNGAENTGSTPEPELNEYMNRMGETLDKLDFDFKTGNSVSDVVIHQAFARARHDGIRFTSEFFFPTAVKVNAYDLAVILQNALENACEACMTLPNGKRFIDIRSRLKGETFFVEISNSYAGDVFLDSQTGLPPTRKTDGGAHGLGLVNIQRTAEKLQGDIAIQLDKKDGIPVFKLTVALQGEPG